MPSPLGCQPCHVMPCNNILTQSTGTNSPLGIGRASAHQFAQNGAKAVYICDFNDSNLETHKRELASLYPGVEVHTRKFDAANEESVKAVVDDAIKVYGRLDVFFANAGVVGQTKVFTEITSEEFLSTLRTNVVRSVSCIMYLWFKITNPGQCSSCCQVCGSSHDENIRG